LYVPLRVGNGEQRRNAADVVTAGGGVLVPDAQFTPDWVREVVVPLLRDPAALAEMAERAAATGVPDGAERLVEVILGILGVEDGRPHEGDQRDRAADPNGGSAP